MHSQHLFLLQQNIFPLPVFPWPSLLALCTIGLTDNYHCFRHGQVKSRPFVGTIGKETQSSSWSSVPVFELSWSLCTLCLRTEPMQMNKGEWWRLACLWLYDLEPTGFNCIWGQIILYFWARDSTCFPFAIN